MQIKDNLDIIKNSISECEKRSGREAGCVKLMAVSKFHSIEEIQQAINNNQILFGENRVQEANEKFTKLYETYSNIDLHIIGQLQSNKVKTAVAISNCIQSVDRIELIKEIEKQCAKIDKKINILFEYHTAEDSKSGFKSEEQIISILDDFSNNLYPHINPCGFMTMAPFTDDEALIRKSFSTLRLLKDKLQKQYYNFNLSELSMGMSNDYKIAIEEGSTLVRIGTAIFGERNYSKK